MSTDIRVVTHACLCQMRKFQFSSIEQINAKRNAWMDDLQKTGISTRPATHAVHMLSFFTKKNITFLQQIFPNAYVADQCSISIPSFHGMKEDEHDFVIQKF